MQRLSIFLGIRYDSVSCANVLLNTVLMAQSALAPNRMRKLCWYRPSLSLSENSSGRKGHQVGGVVSCAIRGKLPVPFALKLLLVLKYNRLT